MKIIIKNFLSFLLFFNNINYSQLSANTEQVFEDLSIYPSMAYTEIKTDIIKEKNDQNIIILNKDKENIVINSISTLICLVFFINFLYLLIATNNNINHTILTEKKGFLYGLFYLDDKFYEHIVIQPNNKNISKKFIYESKKFFIHFSMLIGVYLILIIWSIIFNRKQNFKQMMIFLTPILLSFIIVTVLILALPIKGSLDSDIML